jgi:hypothetical protein
MEKVGAEVDECRGVRLGGVEEGSSVYVNTSKHLSSYQHFGDPIRKRKREMKKDGAYTSTQPTSTPD